MMSSIYSAVSGIKSQGTKLNVIGNNISNVNTIGYKGQTVTFADLLSQTISGATGATTSKGGSNAKQIGTGVSVASTSTITTVGSTQTTGNDQDVAITGNGYYIVQGGGTGKYQFTRAGNFGVDSAGNLTVNGYNVCGWSDYTLDADGNYVFDTDTDVGALNLFANGKQVLAAKQTTKSTLTGAIDASADVHATSTTPAIINEGVLGTTANATTNCTGLTNATTDLAKAFAGTISINGTSVTISSTDTVQSVIDKINNLSATTGVTAEFNIGDGANGYIKLTTTDSGTSAKIKLVGTDTTLQGLFAAEAAGTTKATSTSSSKTATAVGSAANATTNKTGLTAASTVSSQLAGDITISYGTPSTDQNITINSGDSILEVLKAINDQTATTGVSATFVANSGNGYIQLSSNSSFKLSGTDAVVQALFAGEATASATATGSTVGSTGNAATNATGFTADTDTVSSRFAGTFTIKSSTTGKSDATITITSAESISAIVAAINAQTATTGVTAAFVANSGNGYIQLTPSSGVGTDTVTLTGTDAVVQGLFAAEASGTPTVTGTSASTTANLVGSTTNATTNATGFTADTDTVSSRLSGDITIKSSTSGASSSTITIASGESMAAIIAAINAQSATTGITAAFNAGDGTNGYIQLTDTTGGTATLSGTDAAIQDIFAAATSSADTLSTTGLAADGATTLTAYDSLGNSYNVGVNLYKSYIDSTTDPNNPVTYWYWEADTSEDNATVSGSGFIAFDSDGKVITNDANYDATPSITLTPTGSNAGSVAFEVALDMTAIKAQADTDSLTNTTDGYEAGTLSDFSIGSDGTITGIYSNDYTQPLGVIALATFSNAAGLLKLGNGLYTTTVNSGDFTGGVVAGSSGSGSLSAGELEMSNVDLSEQFSEMMITQRAYQANSKVISASDECLQAVINMVS